MTLTIKQLDALCGGPPTLYLDCPFCARTVGPYYALGEAKGALQTHMAYVHFADAVRPIPFRDDNSAIKLRKSITRRRGFRLS